MLRLVLGATLLLALAGCSSFRMGTVLFLPHGQAGSLMVAPPDAGASAAK
jgi:hypothetical protein